MRIPSNSFDRADLELCRVHGDAVANEPDHVLWARMHDSKESLLALDRKLAYHAACDDFERVTLDQAQSDAYWQWQNEVHGGAPEKAPERRYYEQQPDGSVHDVEPAPAEVWHSEAPTVPGLYVVAYEGGRSPSAYRDEPAYARWFGSKWSGWSSNIGCTKHVPTELEWIWLRLVEAEPAEPVQQAQAKHKVCIRSYTTSRGCAWDIGQLSWGDADDFESPNNWLPCDRGGWVTHLHTADSVCPVPNGVRFEVRQRNGTVRDDEGARHIHSLWKTVPGDTLEFAADFVAWRPTGTAA